MKSKEYVRRFGDRLTRGDYTAVVEMLDCMVAECNAQARVQRVVTIPQYKRLMDDFNRKGNVIADMLQQKYGKPLIRRDWFQWGVEMVKEGEKK